MRHPSAASGRASAASGRAKSSAESDPALSGIFFTSQFSQFSTASSASSNRDRRDESRLGGCVARCIELYLHRRFTVHSSVPSLPWM